MHPPPWDKAKSGFKFLGKTISVYHPSLNPSTLFSVPFLIFWQTKEEIAPLASLDPLTYTANSFESLSFKNVYTQCRLTFQNILIQRP